MKKNTPFTLSLIIVIGFFVYVGSNQLMRDSLLIEPDQRTERMMIIGKDTVKVSEKVHQVQTDIITSKGKKSNYLNVFPATILWISFHSTSLAIGIIAAWLLFFLIRSLIKEFDIKFSKTTIFAFIPLLIGVFALMFALETDLILLRSLISGNGVTKYFGIIFPENTDIVRALVGTFLLIAVVPLSGIILINVASKNLSINENLHENMAAHYKSLREKLNTFALVTGFLVAISIVGTQLQKKMIGEQITNIDAIYPNEFIYLYALTFTLILALFFIPSLLLLKRIKIDKKIEADTGVMNLGWWKIGKESVDDVKLIFSMILPLIASVSQIL